MTYGEHDTTGPELHLSRGSLRDSQHGVSLCGVPAGKNVGLIPTHEWNGRRDRVCEDCLRLVEAEKT